MAKHGRSAGTVKSASPPPSPPTPADTLSATYYRATRASSLPAASPAVAAPDTAAMAQRLAADIASLPARWQPGRTAAKPRAR
jgi:hypothetical protein